jgi:hypothetical protein
MKIVVAAALAALACASTSEAFAVEIQCAKHNQMVKFLSKKFNENPIATGTVNEDRFMQLFVSAGGSWTILMTRTDGQACIVAAGKNWDTVPDLASADPAA